MMITRRLLLLASALAAGGVLPARAQDPKQQIKIVVGFGAGGVTDVLARIFAEEFKQRLGRIVIVDNRPGASGVIATGMVARAAPDGTTLIMIPGTHTIIPSLRKLDYDTATALAPINLIASAPNLLVVRKDAPYADVRSLVEAARTNPGTLAYASSGLGTTVHFMAIMLETETGITLNHVPYRSSGESVQAVLGGHVPMSFSAVNAALPSIQAGELRALAIASEKRSALLPDVPTFDEAGILNIRSDTWIGLAAPANTPSDFIGLVNGHIKELLKTEEIQKKISALGADPVGLGPAEFNAVIHRELARFEGLARRANIKRE